MPNIENKPVSEDLNDPMNSTDLKKIKKPRRRGKSIYAIIKQKRKQAIKDMHLKSGYYKKKPRRVVSGGTMSKR